MLQPTRLISTPFAQEGEKTEIQNVTGELDNSATYRLGFPPITMQSIRLGGKPPKGTDFNGVLFDITENISFLCKGGRYQYNAGLSTLIGGYPEGSNLLLDDNITEVVSTVAGNQNNPNINMTGWILKPNKTTAVNVADASGETQQQVNYNGGSKWHSRVGGYLENERVVLANGDIVKSTVNGNANDPNVDMTGWENPAALQALHNKSSATFTDYLTANEIANSATTDLSAKLQAINDVGEIGTLRIPSGTWYINSVVTFNRDFAFNNDPDHILKLGPNGQIKFEGSATLIGNPTTAISKKSKQWGLANSLQPFDLICIFNPVDYSFMPQRSYYKAGEFIKVFAADSTTVTTAGKTWANYDTSVDVYKINPIKIRFNCFNIQADNNAVNNPVIFTFCEDLSLFGYNNIGSKNAGLTIDRCYNFYIPEPMATNNSPLVGLNYGVVIANSQNGRVSGGANIAGRHCVTFGGGAGVCSVPSREVIVSNAVLKTGSTIGTGAGDFHGNTSQCQYINCFIDHASVGGVSNSFYNCTFWDRGIDGAALLFAELGGGEWNIVDCTLIVDNDLIYDRGALDCPFGADLVQDFLLNVQNLTIKGEQTTANFLVKFTVGASVNITKKVRCVIDGITVLLGNHAAIVNAHSANTSAGNIIPNFELNLSNVKTIKTGIAYLQPTQTATSPLSKIKLPSQSGIELITTAGEASGNKVGAVITLPYSYPLPPSVTHSVGTDGTWTVDSSFNLKPVTTMLNTNTASQLRFALLSPSALPASKTFKVSWTASYNT